MSRLRRAVMAEMDDVHETTDGSTPDHIIVYEAIWSDMKEHNRFEELRNPESPKRRHTSPGFMRMRVWHSGALDRRGKDILLLSEEVFDTMFRQTKDF